MRSNSKHTIEELERYIELYFDDGRSYRELRENHGLLLSQSLFGQKVLRYQTHGLKGIETRSSNNNYSNSFKNSVVMEHLKEGIPIKELARKYNIPDSKTVRNWLIKYTKGEENRSYSPLPEVYTMKGQKTTQEEKIEIVKDYLANGMSYKAAAEKYRVSYNNVYSWVQKYKEYGPAGLVDGRGRGKPDSIQTEEEKMRAENAALKARNEYLETENAALKKLEEVERELMSRRRGMRRNTKRSRNYKKKDSK